MSIETDVCTALLAMSAVTALVADRIDVDVFREHTGQPALLIEVEDDNHSNTLDGRGGLVFGELTVTCRAGSPAASRALAEAVRVNGTNPGTGLAGYAGAFDAVLVDVQRAAVPYDDGSDRCHYDTVQTYEISWTETV